MLDQNHADRRQFRDLVAAEPATRPTLVKRELAAAPATSIRVMIDDLIDLILRLQRSTRAATPRLPALRCPRTSSLAFARASARRCCRVFGGSCDGGLELLRDD
jgi:hypothetical protein